MAAVSKPTVTSGKAGGRPCTYTLCVTLLEDQPQKMDSQAVKVTRSSHFRSCCRNIGPPLLPPSNGNCRLMNTMTFHVHL